MAVVLDALAPYLIRTIKDMAEDELRMLLGISGDIQRLSNKMEKMEAYLADAERRRIDDPIVQGWVNQLKDAMYEATDILDLCQLDAEERKRSPGGCWPSLEKKAPGCLQPLLFCLRNPSFARSMGKRIKALNASLDEISKEMSSFKFVKMNSYQVKKLTSEVTPHSRATTSLIDESAIVGDEIQADTRALVQVLLADGDEPATILVVSIVGAGGMGKTTLAKMIFNDRDIQMAFRSKIWLSVTEVYDEKKLLSSSIAQAGGRKEPSEDKEVLTKTLADVLSSTGKVLVVMDDVWSERPWTDVLQSPIIEAARKQPGSRVILTTRNENLVKYMEGATYQQHHVKPLGDEDAWSLLKKQVQRPQATSSASDFDHLKHIGLGIIRKCDGLPLAIKAVGGLLKTKRGNENGWKEEVLGASAWSTDKTHHDLNSALRLSYEDLPPPLKQCFLYYSLLPKGLHIALVTGMWMSEGLVVSQEDRDRRKKTEDISMGYYWDLIARNLLEPDFGIDLDGSFSRMHDVVRSFAQHMAKEEALAIRPGQVSPRLLASSKFRRLSVESDVSSGSPSVVQPEWSSISGKQELLRSLLIIGRMRYDEPSASLSTFPSLRALLVLGGEFDRFVDSLSKLKHLRFLDLEATDISRLPDDIDSMRFLEHIRLVNCPNFDGQLPSSIKKLERLRYIGLVGTKFTVPKGLGALSTLRTITTFPVQMNGGWCSLQELGTLSQLRKISLLGLETVPDAWLAAQAKLHDKEQLRNLFLALGNNIDYALIHPEVVSGVEWKEEDCQRVEVVFDQLCPPPHLEFLSMVSYIGRRPPSWMMSVDLNSLTILDMMGMPFCTQLPDGLCRLPSLESLIIRFAPAIKRVGPEFQRIVNSLVPPFPRLQWLDLDRLLEWDNWEWEEEDAQVTAMPVLETLFTRSCKLHYLPPGLASSNRRALKNLHLQGLVNLSSVHNIPSVVELEVFDCPKLMKISGFFSLQNIRIIFCPNLEVLQDAQKLDILVLADAAMETLPGYLRDVKPRYLYLYCNKKLYESLVSAETSECDKIRHIPTPYYYVIEDSNGESADNNIQQFRYGGIHNQVLHRQPPGRAFVGGGPIFLE